MISQKAYDKKTKKLVKELNDSFQFLINNPHSSFYKNKYKKAGVKLKTIKSIKDFESLPFLTKDEILNINPYEFVFVPLKTVDNIGVTSGTTNQKNPLILLMNTYGRGKKHYDLERWTPFVKAGVKANLLLYPGSISSTYRRLFNYGATKKGIINVIGDTSNFPLTALLAKRLVVDSIESIPTVLYNFIPYLKKEYDLSKIKLVFLSGEYTSEQKYSYLQKIFKNAKFYFNLGSIETSSVAMGCDYLIKRGPRFLHPYDFLYLEVLGKAGEGELVVTD